MEANVSMISCPSCGVEVDASHRVCPHCQFPLDGGAQPFLKGHILEGRYRIDGEIGRGGMGVVYRGTDLTLKRLVAIKAVLTNSADKGVLLRFMHEARALASVEHAGLVPVYAVGQEGGVYYMVMKLLSGHTLADIIKNHGRLEEVTVRKMVVEVCDALEALHDAGLLHRDMKPANLMMGANGRFTVMDLGIVQNIGDDAEGVRAAAMGTPKYMPPEMFSNREVDGRADLYSLGIIAYHAIVGKPPFDGPTPMAILYRQAHEDAPPLYAADPKVSRAFSDIIERVMAKEPEKRFPDARSLAEEVRMAPPGRSSENLRTGLVFALLFVLGAVGGVIYLQPEEVIRARPGPATVTTQRTIAPKITIVEAPPQEGRNAGGAGHSSSP